MSDANTNPVTCPSCGSINPIGSAFCQDCGKKFSTEPINQTLPKNQSYESQTTHIENHPLRPRMLSERQRNIIIVMVAGILIASLLFAAVLTMAPYNNDNNSQASTTPSATLAPTRIPTAQPTATSTPSPTLMPTLQPPNSTITAVNLQFVYQSTDQNNFGPTAQTLSFTNQPNGMLTLNPGSEFWYSFKLTEATPASPDSITKISVSTPGFTLVYVTPATPIVFTQGSSATVTVHVLSPQTSFEGPVTLVLTTSG